jgi:hypothetical protein
MPFFNGAALLVLVCALAVSCLIYLKNIKAKLIPIANLCSLLVLLVSIILIINLLAGGFGEADVIAENIALCLLMNLYAVVCNVAARVWARVLELMGKKRVKLSLRAEIVER